MQFPLGSKPGSAPATHPSPCPVRYVLAGMVRLTWAESLNVAPGDSNLFATAGSTADTSLEKPMPVVSFADDPTARPPEFSVTGTEKFAALGVPGADVIQ